MTYNSIPVKAAGGRSRVDVNDNETAMQLREINTKLDKLIMLLTIALDMAIDNDEESVG